MRKIRTVDGGLFSAPLLDADGNLQYIPILGKDGKQVLNSKGEPAFELIRERDMPLPDFLTINPGGNAQELISQRKAFEAYGAQDAARRATEGNFDVDTLRVAAATNKNIEIPRSLGARVKEVLSANPQLKAADLAKMDQFKDVSIAGIKSHIGRLRRKGGVPGLAPPTKRFPLTDLVEEILTKNPGITLDELKRMGECSGCKSGSVQRAFRLCGRRVRQLAVTGTQAAKAA